MKYKLNFINVSYTNTHRLYRRFLGKFSRWFLEPTGSKHYNQTRLTIDINQLEKINADISNSSSNNMAKIQALSQSLQFFIIDLGK
jgi:hypothetical protein